MGYEIRTTHVYGIYAYNDEDGHEDCPDWLVDLLRELYPGEWESTHQEHLEWLQKRTGTADGPLTEEDMNCIRENFVAHTLSEAVRTSKLLTSDEDGPMIHMFDHDVVVGIEISTSFVKPGRGSGILVTPEDTEDLSKARQLVDEFFKGRSLPEGLVPEDFELSYES